MTERLWLLVFHRQMADCVDGKTFHHLFIRPNVIHERKDWQIIRMIDMEHIELLIEVYVYSGGSC
jgi:hypothetical protein